MIEDHGIASGSGGPVNNLTCDTFYESVIVAIEALNAGMQYDTRSVNFFSQVRFHCESETGGRCCICARQTLHVH